ncbi:MAG: hypothetical protein ABL888_04610 [Pirellulaceae bacterium]
MPNERFQIVADVIRNRKTTKLIATANSPVTITDESNATFESNVRAAIATAGWAPFHFDRQVDGIAEPWRVHFVRWQTCRAISKNFCTWFSDVKPGNKLPGMLNACGALLLVNWLPHSEDEVADFAKRQDVNLEHHAASSAFVENLLLLLTALDYATYWSSGGQLKSPPMFQRLGIPANEQLLAAVFVENPAAELGNVERASGKLRQHRADVAQWLKFPELSE